MGTYIGCLWWWAGWLYHHAKVKGSCVSNLQERDNSQQSSQPQCGTMFMPTLLPSVSIQEYTVTQCSHLPYILGPFSTTTLWHNVHAYPVSYSQSSFPHCDTTFMLTLSPTASLHNHTVTQCSYLPCLLQPVVISTLWHNVHAYPVSYSQSSKPHCDTMFKPTLSPTASLHSHTVTQPSCLLCLLQPVFIATLWCNFYAHPVSQSQSSQPLCDTMFTPTLSPTANLHSHTETQCPCLPCLLQQIFTTTLWHNVHA